MRYCGAVTDISFYGGKEEYLKDYPEDPIGLNLRESRIYSDEVPMAAKGEIERIKYLALKDCWKDFRCACCGRKADLGQEKDLLPHCRDCYLKEFEKTRA